MKKLRKKLKDFNLKTYLKTNPHIIILLVLMGLAAFFAFFNFPYRYALHDEVIRDIGVAVNGAREIQFPLIGGFASTGPFTFGPWTYFQYILISMLIPSAYAPFIYLGLAYLGSVLILYLIGKELGDSRLGLIMSLLGVLSPALIIGSTHLTTSNLLTFWVLLATFLFIKIIKGGVSYWWGFFYGIVMGIAMNMNYQSLSLLILPLIMLAVKIKKIWYFVAFCVGAFLMFLPLLFFDLNNHWVTVRNFWYYINHGNELIYVPNSWTLYIREFWPSLWGDVIGIQPMFAFVIMLSVAGILLYQLYKRNLSVPIFLLALAFFIDFVAMRYFEGQRFFGYFNFFRPFIFIFTGYVLYFILTNVKFGKFILLSLFVVYFVIVLPKSFARLEVDPGAIDAYRQVSELYEIYPENNFRLFTCSESYKSNTGDIPKSLLFVLSKDGKISENGVPILINKERCITEDISTFQHNINVRLGENKDIENIPNTNIHLIPKVTVEELIDAGWNEENFKTIYDNTARWWFDEKPE